MAARQILIVLALAFAHTLAARAEPSGRTGEALALAWRDLVVRIEAGPNIEDGFGIIVGMDGRTAYAVTANHVVRPPAAGPGGGSDTIAVSYFGAPGERHSAQLLDAVNRSRDLAVLRLELPERLQVQADILVMPDNAPARNDKAWFVGRNRQWFVPPLDTPGRVTSVDPDDLIHVENLGVQPGTSGAPLIGEAGLAGMIVIDAGGTEALALDIGVIERFMRYSGLPFSLVRAREHEAQVKAEDEPAPPTKPTIVPTSPEAEAAVSQRVMDRERLRALLQSFANSQTMPAGEPIEIANELLTNPWRGAQTG